MAERVLQLVLHYDGTDFAGWQVQRAERTVQGVIEAALARLHEHPVRIAGAGRTDAGVHARGQAASVQLPSHWTAEKLRRVLNALEEGKGLELLIDKIRTTKSNDQFLSEIAKAPSPGA